jgi:hypothetical protein
MSNGSHLHHTIRHSDDTWQDFFGLIETLWGSKTGHS